MSQLSFISLAHAKKKLKREKFLRQMDQVIPWGKLIKVVEPFYKDQKMGRKKMPLKRMLKIMCLQQWYNLSDPAVEEEIYDRMTFQKFLKLDLLTQSVPDETTILNFRHLLEEYNLQGCIFEEINEHLTEKGFLMKEGTIVDATLLAAPTSTKNTNGKRDPEMSSTKKNNQWYFGMKAHIGVDAESGLVHSLTATTAKDHDSSQFDELLHGEEQAVYGDKAYVNESKKQEFEKAGGFWAVLEKASRGKKLKTHQELWNRYLSSTRARVEHPFQVLKCQFGYRKVKYRGIEKNLGQLYLLFGLHNLFKVRKQLILAS